MCGRFAIATPIHELADIMGCEPLSDLTPFEASWNVAPQTSVPVGTEVGVHGEINVPRHFRLMQWGFRPSWSKASNREPINARSETMHEKPMFRNAAKHRRGFVPADGWYEWMTTPQGKAPWFHQRMDTQPTMLAVLWETWANETLIWNRVWSLHNRPTKIAKKCTTGCRCFSTTVRCRIGSPAGGFRLFHRWVLSTATLFPET